VLDWLGRPVSVTQPTTQPGQTFTRTRTYASATGLLQRVSEPGLGDHLYEYDATGRLTREGIDVDGTTALDDVSRDRVTEYQRRYVRDGNGDVWLQQQTLVLPEDNSASRLIVSRQEERLTGFVSPVSAERRSWANEGITAPYYATLPLSRATQIIERTYATEKRVETTVTEPGVSNGAVTQVLNGVLARVTRPSGAKVDYTIDALGRTQRTVQNLANANPSDGPVTVEEQTEYWPGTRRPRYVRGPDAGGNLVVQSELDYNADGRLKSAKNALGKVERYEYTTRGELEYVWGDATNPLRREYGGYGQVTRLTTYRSGTDWTAVSRPVSFQNAGDPTTFVYHEATGLLQERQDALHTPGAPRAVRYTYDTANRLQKRTWARTIAGQPLEAVYGYDPKTGELLTANYSDTTPDVTRTYTRAGDLRTVTDATGTRTFGYRSGVDSALETESLDPVFYGAGRLLKYKYNATTRRPEGYVCGVAPSVTSPFTEKHLDLTYALDPANGRLASAQSLTRNDARSHTFAYGYLGGSSLVASISGPQGPLQKQLYETSRLLLRSSQVRQDTALHAGYEYTRDLAGQIDTEQQTGSLFTPYGTGGAVTVDYDYNDRGELLRAQSKVNSQTVELPDRFWEWSYDDAGSRKEEWRNAKDTAHREAYTANGLNQVTSKTGRAYQNARGFGTAGYYYFALRYPYSGTYTPLQPGGGTYFYREIPRPGSGTGPETITVDLMNTYGGNSGSQPLPYSSTSEPYAAKTPLWTSTKAKTGVENAFGHWQKHGAEFPEFQNAKQYVEGAKDFFSKPPSGTLTKTRPNGDTLFYNPANNTFGVQAADGAPRTMFRPTDGINYWNKQ
jgi:YD repeat-containing protein